MSDHDYHKRVASLAAAMVTVLKEYVLKLMDEQLDREGEVHLAFSIALEAMRGATVLAYNDQQREIIYQAAAALVKPAIDRPKVKG